MVAMVDSMITYKKIYHDNVRRSIRSETFYTPDQLDHEISVIANSIFDTLTDHNNDLIINRIINAYRRLIESEDDINTDFYDYFFDYLYIKMCSRLETIFGVNHRLNGGDYDIVKITEEGEEE